MIKNEILNEYKHKLEIHSHTSPVSICSETKVKDLVDYFIEDGYSAIAITNHFIKEYTYSESPSESAEYFLSAYREAKKYAAGRISVCLGMEIRFTENINDYLVYGISEGDVEKAFYYFDKGIETFYRKFKNERNVIIQAHPFRNGIELADTRFIDGIEAFNFHPDHNSRVSHAAVYAVKNSDKIITGGIDFHSPHQRNEFAMRTKFVPQDSYELSELLKSRDFVFTVGDSLILP